MIKINLFGNGLAAELFLYCLMKLILEKLDNGDSVERMEIYRGSIGERNSNKPKVRSSFYIHKFLDNNLTPEIALRRIRFSVAGHSTSDCKSDNYDLKVFNCNDVTNGNEIIEDIFDNNLSLNYERYCGGIFCHMLEYYCKKYYGELRLRNKFEIVDFLEDFNRSDYNIYAEPLYNFNETSDIKFEEDVYPIGVEFHNNYKHNNKEDSDVVIEYNVDKEQDHFRTTYDLNYKIKILEYSLNYNKNTRRIYNGGIIYPGKILVTDINYIRISDFKREVFKKFKNGLIFLGRYSSWNPNIVMVDNYNYSMEIASEIILLK